MTALTRHPPARLCQEERSHGIAASCYDLAHVAAHGPHVLTERVDSAYDVDGNLHHAFKVMRRIKVEEGRIAWVRDYFYDTRVLAENYLPEAHEGEHPLILDDVLRSGD